MNIAYGTNMYSQPFAKFCNTIFIRKHPFAAPNKLTDLNNIVKNYYTAIVLQLSGFCLGLPG